MARKSRKAEESDISIAFTQTLSIRVGFYLRLSVEDSKGRSQSIENQRLVLNDYLAERPEFQLVDIYTDNGLTGTNFSRPEFLRLLADIDKGRINCVMVKDLSRLGRNFIDTSYYIEQYFSERNVRFIAVTDQFDTGTVDMSRGNIMLPLKNMINEAYAVDIGRKIRAQQHQAMLDGKFIGAWAPYGYRKDPEDCHRLLIDPEAAAIVQKIFQWAAERVSLNEIVRRLNEEGIKTPSCYFTEKGVFSGKKMTEKGLWQTWTVRKMLLSEVYVGDLVQGKRRSVDHRQINTTRDQYIVVRNTHEPVVSRELFNRVKVIIEEAGNEAVKKRKKHFTPNVYIGKVFCAHCGRPLHRQWASRQTMPDEYRFHCLTNNRYRKDSCPGVSIREKDLTTIVMAILNREIKTILGKWTIEADEQEQNEDRKQEISLRREIENSQMLLRSLYEKLTQGMITESEYVIRKANHDEKIRQLKARLDETRERQEARKSQAKSIVKLTADAAKLAKRKKLPMDIIQRLIDRIEVTHNHEVNVYFHFQNPFRMGASE